MGKEYGSEPLVTVVMPAYNAERYIRQAMESVCKQQGCFGIELLVIDDKSTDGTREAAESCRKNYETQGMEKTVDRHGRRCPCDIVCISNEKNLGVAETRNVGIRRARGKYIAFLDADDWWNEEKLRRQVGFLEKYDGVLCATGRELVNPDGSSMGRVIAIPEEITYKMLLSTNSIPCSSVLMKTRIAQEFGMCHDELHEDYILWLRVLKKYGKAYGINEPLLKSRMSEGGKSRNKLKSAKMQYGVYRYMGIGRIRSLCYFFQYAVNGVLKYHG